jgi:hypothetical protein
MHEKCGDWLEAFNAYRSAKTTQASNPKALEGIERLKPILEEKGIKY